MANATHFRYGSITWQQTGAPYNIIQFKVSVSYRLPQKNDPGNIVYYDVNTGPTLTPYVGETLFVSTSDQRLFFGDGSYTRIDFVVTTIDPVNGWMYGEFVTTHTYNTGGNKTAYFESCCTISTLDDQQGDKSYRVETIVNVGTNNNPPVASIAPIVYLQINDPNANFFVPATDPNGDVLRWRIANQQESSQQGGSFNIPAPPGFTIESTTGHAHYSTVGKNVGGQNEVSLMIEDLDANGFVKSKVPVTFIMQYVAQSSPPQFDYSITPANNSEIKVQPGTPINFNVRAFDTDFGSTVELNATGAPSGATWSTPLPILGIMEINSSFSWTPTAANLGSYVVNITATDNFSVQTSTSVTIVVSLSPIFDVPPTPNYIFILKPGENASFTAQAHDPDPLDVVSITEAIHVATNTPMTSKGASLTPALPTAAMNTTSTAFSWNPTQADWGTNDIRFKAVDSYGDNTTYTVTVLVNTPPEFISTPVTSAIAGQPYSYSVTTLDPDLPYGDMVELIMNNPDFGWLTLTDNEDGTGTLSGTPPLTAIGSYTINLLAEDLLHHSNPNGIPEQTFDIIVTDQTPPTIICPADFTVDSDPGKCDAMVNYQEPIGTDDNPGTTTDLMSGIHSGSIFQLGTTTTTFLATDAAGITASCAFSVTVEDHEAPVAQCKNVTAAIDGSGFAAITDADINNGSSDNCGIKSIVVQNYSFDCSQLGANTATLVVTDNSDNSSSCIATVTVEDNIAPVAKCQDLNINLDGSGNASIAATDVDNGSSDNCSITNYALSQYSFDCSMVGTHNVQMTVTDAKGLQSSCTSAVTVNDVSAPVAICTDITIQLDGNGNASILASDVDGGSSDNCTIESSSLSQSSFSCADLGVNLVTLNLADASGNPGSCIAKVTVEDKLAPTLTCKDVTVSLDGNGQASIIPTDIATSGSDNCSIANLSLDQTQFDCSSVGVHAVQLTAVDPSGNSVSCSQSVTVVDNTLPVAKCQDFTVNLDANGIGSIATGNVDNGSSDNCSIATSVLDQYNFDCTNIGTVTVKLTVTDASSNSSSCTSTVTVADPLGACNKPPVAVCQNITISTDATCSASVSTSQVDGGSYDPDNDPMTFTLDNTGPFGVGVYPVVLTVSDGQLTDQCNATVTVKDNTAPNAVCKDVSVSLNASGQAFITIGDVDGGSSDACGISSRSISPASLDCSMIGTQVVTLLVADVNGNTSSCASMVKVSDNISPTINCPASVTVNNDPGVCGANVLFSTPSGSDNCSVSIAQTAGQASGSSFQVGSTTNTFVATDGSDNSAACSFNIVVIDAENPVISSITVPVDPVALGTPVNVSANNSDNCGIVSTTWYWGDGSNSPTGSHIYAMPGVYQVSLSVTDAAGNSVLALAANYVVVYDPSAGFVTGGGWIQSPPGAYSADPNLTGKANFGFVSKYKKGSNVPEGNTEFQFKAGDLNFKSYVYEWLVIAGANAKFKGSGHINGQGDYDFMLTGNDGDLLGQPGPDQFRIKIWDRQNGGVIYDNKQGSDETGYNAQDIAGGSITIHSSNGNKNFEVDPTATILYFNQNNLVTNQEEVGNPNAGKEDLVAKRASSLFAYPNPFRDEVTFNYHLETAGQVKIDLISMDGRTIKEIINTYQPKGNYQLHQNATTELGINHSNGIYLVKFMVDGKLIQYTKLVHLD